MRELFYYDPQTRRRVLHEIEPLPSIFPELQTREYAEKRRANAARRNGAVTFGVLPSVEATRLNFELPPWIAFALHIVERDAINEGKEIPLLTRLRLARLDREALEEIELKNKLDTLVRMRLRQQKIDANAEAVVDDDWLWQGGIPNRFRAPT
jgi:hypothetical protein